jgi:hypothetical protein
MKKLFLLFLLLALVAVSGVFPQDNGDTGDVEGFVLDDANRPIVGAQVSAFVANRPSVGTWPQATSGVGGHFLITGVWPPGLYQITAQKPREGYGDPATVLFASPSAQAPTVEVRARVTTQGVMVRLGPRGGWVTGVVEDAASGQEVRGASAGFISADSRMEYGGGSIACHGKFFLLSPSDKSVRVRFSAPGYETWYLGPDGSEAHATPIRISPGETKEIVVRLLRLKGPAPDAKPATCGDRVTPPLGR